MERVRHAVFVVVERLLLWAVVPQLRARLLRCLGASVGRNVRVYEARFFNVQNGFSNLELDDDVHVGHGTLIDLSDRVVIGRGAVVSPRCVLISHTDAGEFHGSAMCRHVPTSTAPCVIGAESYLGAGAIVLSGVTLGPLTAVGAGAVVTESTEGDELVAGVPARRVRRLGGDHGTIVAQ